MVNDENDEPIVNDEERYEAMLAKRQERRAVINLICIKLFHRVNQCMISIKDRLKIK